MSPKSENNRNPRLWAVLFAVFGFFLAIPVGAGIGLILVPLLDVSNFEGGQGYFVLGLIKLSIPFVMLISGILGYMKGKDGVPWSGMFWLGAAGLTGCALIIISWLL